MRQNPALYGIPQERVLADPMLTQWREDLIHTAAVLLDKHNLIKYDKRAGIFQVRFNRTSPISSA